MNSSRSVWKAVLRRWRRNVITVAAVGIGAASVVAILGVNESAAQRIAERLAALEASSITAALPSSAWAVPEEQLISQTGRLPGVVAAGTLTLPDAGVIPSDLIHPVTNREATAGTVVATPAGLIARRATVVEGNFPTDVVLSKDPRQILLGSRLARELGVSTREGANRLNLNGVLVTVVGIVQDTAGNSVLDSAAIVSVETAEHFNLLPTARNVLVAISPGSGITVAGQLPVALFPSNSEEVVSAAPPSPAQLKDQLLGDNRNLVTVVTVVMVTTSLLSIVATMQIAVWERRREIGISRALGASRADIALNFFKESVLLGFLGAAAGFAIGVTLTAVITSAISLDLVFPLGIAAVPVVGSLVGAVAGVIPARAASAVEPSELLRSQ